MFHAPHFQFGIQPEMGIETLDRILSQPYYSQIIVSPRDLNGLLENGRPGFQIDKSQGPDLMEPNNAEVRTEKSNSHSADVTETLQSLWREALGIDNIGDTDNFFELGGDSLSMVQIVARLRDRFGLNLPLSNLLEKSTITNWTRVVQRALNVD